MTCWREVAISQGDVSYDMLERCIQGIKLWFMVACISGARPHHIEFLN